MPRRRPVLIALGLGLLAGAGCETTAPETPGFIGEWVAVSWTAVNGNDAGQQVELMDEGWFQYLRFEETGGVIVVEWEAEAGYRLGQAPWAWEDDRIRFPDVRGTSTVTATWEVGAAGQLELTLERDAGYDFDGDDSAEPTEETLVMVNVGRGPNQPDPRLVGQWTLDGWLLTSQADPGDTAELTDLGATFGLTLGLDGQFRYSRRRPDPDGSGANSSAVGDYHTVMGTLWLLRTAALERLEYTTDSTTTTFSFPSQWDFDGDGSMEDADAVITLVRP